MYGNKDARPNQLEYARLFSSATCVFSKLNKIGVTMLRGLIQAMTAAVVVTRARLDKLPTCQARCHPPVIRYGTKQDI